MSRRPPKPPPGGLTDEERALWEHAAQSLSPLKRRKPRVTGVEPAPTSTASDEPPQRARANLTRVPLPIEVPTKRKASPPTPSPDAFDRKAASRLRRGQAEVEARIDLHGMKRAEAHRALVRFIHASHVARRRVVLVITGKGKQIENEDGYGMRERGVLKREVPQWLASPDLSPLVVSFTAAAIRHGGEGALYVHLRNPEKLGRR